MSTDNVYQHSQLVVNVIPEWVYNALMRKKLNTIDLKNYSKVREVLSTDDMAGWLYLNHWLKFAGNFLSTNGSSGLFSEIDEYQRKEVEQLLNHQSKDPEVQASVTARLTLTEEELAEENRPGPYFFVKSNLELYLVIRAGFMNRKTDSKFLVDFTRDYLKECYSVASIPVVNTTGAFRLYVKSILNSASPL